MRKLARKVEKWRNKEEGQERTLQSKGMEDGKKKDMGVVGRGKGQERKERQNKWIK